MREIKTKVEKEMPEFADSVQTLSDAELNERLARLAKDTEELEESKENDEGLKQLQESLKVAKAPYSDGKKAIRLKSRYIIQLLKDRGKE